MAIPTNIAQKVHCRACGHEKEVTEEWLRELRTNREVEDLLDALSLLKCKNGCGKQYIDIRPSVPSAAIRK